MKELPPQATNTKDVAGLTQRLVQIPSYVNIYDNKTGQPVPPEQRVDEIAVSTYIADYLQAQTNLTVRTQQVVDGRFNVIAANTEEPKLVLLGHTDTVRPSVGGMYDQLAAEIHDGKIYGLGAADMKSGLASILSAVSLFKDLPDVMLAFYIDEEYDFAGMRALIKNINLQRPPDLMLSADGSDLQLGNGCRGLLEIHGTMRGKSAHAARPHLGINAINGVVNTFRNLQEELAQFSHGSLGDCTVNLASLDGGKASTDENGQPIIVEQVNAVPDIAKFKVDIRTSSPKAKSDLITEYILSYCNKRQLEIDGLKIQHDLGAWYTDKSELTRLAQIVETTTGKPVQYGDIKSGGYIDMQMLWNATGQPPAAMFGAGPNNMAHKPDEYVVIDDLLQSRDVFVETIHSFQRR